MNLIENSYSHKKKMTRQSFFFSDTLYPFSIIGRIVHCDWSDCVSRHFLFFDRFFLMWFLRIAEELSVGRKNPVEDSPFVLSPHIPDCPFCCFVERSSFL